MLITQECFSYCRAVLSQHQGLFCSPFYPPVSGLRMHKILSGNTAGTDDSGCLGLSCHMALWSAVKTEENKEEGGHVLSENSCLPNSITHHRAPFSWSWLNNCLQWEVGNKFFILLCLCTCLLFFLLNWRYFNPRVFSLLILSPSHCRVVIWKKKENEKNQPPAPQDYFKEHDLSHS